MHRPSRTRRILKWTGVGLSLLILTSWAISLKYEASVVISPNWVVAFGRGFVGGGIARLNARTSFGESNGLQEHSSADLGFKWPDIAINVRTGPHDVVSFAFLPFWLVLLLTALPTAWLWHRDRRRIRPGCCIRCGYDLTGNTSGVCSECGEKIAGATPPPATV